MASSGTVKIVIHADGKQAAAELNMVSGKVKETSGQVSQAGKTAEDSWKKLASTGAAVAGVAGLTLSLGELVRTTAEIGMKMESLQKSFKAITGSSVAAGQELDFVRATATRLGADFMSLAESYKSVAAASRGTSMEGEETREIFTAISEASAALGLSSEETKGALLAVGQMMSKGNVQAEELRGQLGERLPGAFQLAAKAMGVTTAELNKMLEKGEVVASDFLPKFAKTISGEYKGSAAEAAKTFQGKLNLLGNELTTLATSIWNSGLEASFSAIVSAFSRATAAVNRYREATAKTPNVVMGLGEFYEPETRREDISGQVEDIHLRNMAARRRQAEIDANLVMKQAAAAEEYGKSMSKQSAVSKQAVKDSTEALESLKEITTAQLELKYMALQFARSEEIKGTPVGGDVGIRTGGVTSGTASDVWQSHRKDLSDTAKAYDELQRAIEGWGKKSASAVADFVFGAKGDFADLFQSIAKEVATMGIYKGVTEPLFGSLGKGFGSAWEFLAGLFHGGGVVGATPVPAKLVDPAVFAGARRYHSGLASDEFPAILQRGETVLPRGVGAAPSVRIEINNQSGQQLSVERQGMTRSDSEGYILGVVLKAARTNESFNRGMAAMLAR